MCYSEELVLRACISLALRGPSLDEDLVRYDTMDGCSGEVGSLSFGRALFGVLSACWRKTPHANRAS